MAEPYVYDEEEEPQEGVGMVAVAAQPGGQTPMPDEAQMRAEWEEFVRERQRQKQRAAQMSGGDPHVNEMAELLLEQVRTLKTKRLGEDLQGRKQEVSRLAGMNPAAAGQMGAQPAQQQPASAPRQTPQDAYRPTSPTGEDLGPDQTAYGRPGAQAPYLAPGQRVQQGGVPGGQLPQWMQYVPGGQQMIQGVQGSQQRQQGLQQQQQEMRNTEQQMALQKQQFQRQGLIAAEKMLYGVAEMPAQWRKYYLDQMAKTYAQVGGKPIDAEFMKAVKGLTDTEIRDMATIMGILRHAHPNLTLEQFTAMASNPAIGLQTFSMLQKAQKQQAEQAQQQLLISALGGFGQTPQGAPGGAPPAGPGETSSQIETMIAQEAQRQGVDPKLAVAVARQESSLNPRAVGDNGASIGVFQLQVPAAQEMGLAPEQRWDVPSNIRAGVGFLKKKIDANGGNVQAGVRAYNGGGDPNYVANVMRWYGQSPSDNPARTDAEIAGLEQRIARLRSIPQLALNPQAQQVLRQDMARLSQLQQQRNAALDRTKPAPDLYADQAAYQLGYPNFASVPPEQRANVSAIGEALRLGAKGAETQQQAQIQRREGVAEKPEMIGGGLPAGTTRGEVEALPIAERKVYKDLPDKELQWFAAMTSAHKQGIALEQKLQNPHVQKYLGSVLYNPTVWLDRNFIRQNTGLDAEGVEALAGIAYLSAGFRHALGGAQLTPDEAKRFDPFLPKEGDNPQQAINKTRSLVNLVANDVNAKRKFYTNYRTTEADLPLVEHASQSEPAEPSAATATPRTPTAATAQEPPAAAPSTETQGFLRKHFNKWWRGGE